MGHLLSVASTESIFVPAEQPLQPPTEESHLIASPDTVLKDGKKVKRSLRRPGEEKKTLG